MVRRDYTKATDTMNSQEFRTAARTTFALAMDAYYAVSNDNDATMEQLIAADVAKTAADAQWIADQHTANTMAQAELDAATAKGCAAEATEPTRIVDDVDTSYDDEEIDEALDAIREAVIAGEGYAHLVGEAEGLGVSRFVISDVIATAKAETTKPVTATLDTSEAFGTAWGADGQVLSYDETVEAIAKRDGWFDREGRWVNKARLMKEARAMLAK